MRLSVSFQRFIIIEIFFFAFLWHRLIKRRHRNIDMSFKDQLRHKTVEQGKQQCGNVCSIHIRIGHDNDFIIAQLTDIKVIAISFGKAAAKCIDHGLDFCIGKYFINTCFFYVQDLTTDWQDCLEHTVSGCLRRTAGRISLDDKNLAFGCITAFTVRKLTVTVK